MPDDILPPLSEMQPAPEQVAGTKAVAIIGASNDRAKFGNKAVRAFRSVGWRVFPVNPHEQSVEGLPTVASVDQIGEPLDVVSLYVPADVGLRLLPAIAAARPGELWVNPGAGSHELTAAAFAQGLKPVDTCSILQIGRNPGEF